jgi:hypothetical protein
MLGVSPKPDGSFSVFVKPEWKGSGTARSSRARTSGRRSRPDAQAIAAG